MDCVLHYDRGKANDPIEGIRERVAKAIREESLIRDHLQIHERNVAKGKPGHCFGVAFWLALATNQTLVHAALNKPPLCVPHAWVLFDETVIVDLTQDLFCHADNFPHHVHLAIEFRGKPRLRELMDKAKDYGPWNEGLRNLNDAWISSPTKRV
jgi:hypothetical protein